MDRPQDDVDEACLLAADEGLLRPPLRVAVKLDEVIVPSLEGVVLETAGEASQLLVSFHLRVDALVFVKAFLPEQPDHGSHQYHEMECHFA